MRDGDNLPKHPQPQRTKQGGTKPHLWLTWLGPLERLREDALAARMLPKFSRQVKGWHNGEEKGETRTEQEQAAKV